ncbi:MAG: HAMP domain-containing sensor histidine kinase [bacterium]|nr:HAMP domain-containing sensor histidine kinase [bacterium]
MSKESKGKRELNFMQKYHHGLIKTHVLIAAISLLIMIALLYVQDTIFNGRFIDFVSDTFGYEVAINLIISKKTLIICFGFGIILIGYCIVEIHAIKKLGRVFKEMNCLFKKDTTLLELDDEFKDIEVGFNELKLENMRNEQLAQLEVQRKNDLIAYLAHDIKTPLSSVIGYLSLLDEATDMPEEQKKKYTKITLDKACRVEQLINEFFEITRFNLSTIPLQKEKIDLQFMLAQMADEFYPMLEKSGHTIEVDVARQLYVEADPDKIARVFNNIIKNAIAYSFKGTTIKIKGFEEQENIVITIKDKGTMIPKENLKMIFDKFYRLDEARSTNTGGAGLGLAIAKEIVLAHDGEIVVTSNEEETCFTIRLPKVKQ